MRAAAGSFANYRRALKVLQVVAALFGARKSPVACQHIDRLIEVAGAGQRWRSPVLSRFVPRPEIKVVQMDRLVAEKIAADISDHLGTSSAVLAKVDD